MMANENLVVAIRETANALANSISSILMDATSSY